MLYPIFSYEDSTEVTASKPDKDGRILLYIEKFDEVKDEFINATIDLSSMMIKSASGYTKNELEEMVNTYSMIKEDIIDYVMEKVRRSA